MNKYRVHTYLTSVDVEADGYKIEGDFVNFYVIGDWWKEELIFTMPCKEMQMVEKIK
jgi:hypothetical protein